MCSMQAPKEKMPRRVHISTLFSGGKKPGIPSRAQGFRGEQRDEDGEERPGRRSEEGSGFVEYKKVHEELNMYKLSQENQMLQLTAQKGTTGYKSFSSLVAWNNNNNGTSNGINGTNGIGIGVGTGVSFFHDHNGNNVMLDPSTFGYPSNYMQLGNPEKMRQEKHIDSVVVPFQQQYYHSSAGNCQLNQVNSKTFETTIWEGDS
ncbi:hypothetical protein FNV43_RR13724 [Rhamnella rubrinervis]|uniref:Uncharacterized protein n=1 Tax=Rhamnella rubrinervis TaxID=2594499 RepID=A0A8K0MEQ2_9ROSA|nr:hypothetical protein FNV43_RR13724 [Rhamnella rubrinervis]